MAQSCPRAPLTRTYVIGLAAPALFLGLQTRAQFREIEAGRSDYSSDARQKRVWISSLRGHLGYGGIIRRFKNYVLRQNPAGLSDARVQIAQFNKVAEAFPAASPRRRANARR